MGVAVGVRAVGWTAWIGCLAGVAAAVVLAAGVALAEGEWGALGMLAVVMALYGAPIGVVVGWVVGLPVVAAAGMLRRRTSRWRGFAVAVAGLGALVLAVAFFGAAPLGFLLAPVSAAGAWWGLGRVFTDDPDGVVARGASTLIR